MVYPQRVWECGNQFNILTSNSGVKFESGVFCKLVHLSCVRRAGPHSDTEKRLTRKIPIKRQKKRVRSFAEKQFASVPAHVCPTKKRPENWW